jgi:hypothetical protein
MIRRPHVLALFAVASGLAGSPAGHASELTYTYVDFQAVGTSGGQTGQKVPVPGQTVAAETQDGDGIPSSTSTPSSRIHSASRRRRIISISFRAGLRSAITEKWERLSILPPS